MAVSTIDPNGLNIGQIGGRRNIVTNGGLTVWQRGTSSVAINAGGNFLADRFQMWDGTSGAATAEQSTEAPDSFATSLKLQVTTADTSLSSTAYMQLGYYIEGQDLQRLAYGTAEAKTVTLSFYVRSNKTGTYGISVVKFTNTRYQFVKEYTINTADTWERKTITIEPDANIKASGGVIDNDNGLGYSIYWNLAMGSTYASATDNVWSSTNNDYSTTNVNNWMDSTSNNFYITGVQLEVSPSGEATPYEHRSYGEELNLCKRYFEKFNYANTEYVALGSGGGGTTTASATFHYTEKRAVPTVDLPNAGQSSGSISFLTATGGYPSSTGDHSVQVPSTKQCRIYGFSYTGLGTGTPSVLFSTGSTSVTVDAEL